MPATTQETGPADFPAALAAIRTALARRGRELRTAGSLPAGTRMGVRHWRFEGSCDGVRTHRRNVEIWAEIPVIRLRDEAARAQVRTLDLFCRDQLAPQLAALLEEHQVTERFEAAVQIANRNQAFRTAY